MSLGTFLVNYEEWIQHYNCSMYDVDRIPLEQRSRPVRGILLMAIGIILETCYILCIYAMCKKAQRRQQCYKIMIYLGLVEIFGIFLDGIVMGWLTIEGAAYCSRPLLIYFTAVIAIAAWNMESVILIFLSLNRCLVVCNSQLYDRIFGNSKMTFAWIFVPIFEAIFQAWYSPPIIFNAQSTGSFHNPHYHYLPDNDFYHNIIWNTHNMVVLCTVIAIYVTFGVIFYKKIGTGVLRSGTTDRRMRKEYNTFIQIAITCVLFAASIIGYNLEQHFPDSQFLILMGTYGYVFFQGSSAIIYLALNATIRKEIRNTLTRTHKSSTRTTINSHTTN
ncbi:serpentine type 7TM GPCR chemoreceptor srt domain-containing protein [Ditylenchus destructor]|nr:serpentine type 7TM GPCR chemoreceptor srt domain-containing protein [Ditylenchus destructor]